MILIASMHVRGGAVQRVFDGRRRGFVVTASIIVAVGAGSIAFRISVPSYTAIYALPLFLVRMLCEFAICGILTLVFTRARLPMLVPLALAHLAGGIVLGAAFLSFPLPGSDAVESPNGTVSLWLLVLWYVVLALGALWYVVERERNTVLALAPTRRIVALGLPGVAIVSLAVVVVVAVEAHALPQIVVGLDGRGVHQNEVGYAVTALMFVALGGLARLLRRGNTNVIDRSAALGILSATVASVVFDAADARLDAALLIARLLNCFASLILLVGVVKYLVENLSEGARLEASFLQAEAIVHEENAAVEASLVKSRFVAMVSHELRTPLGGIIGMAELLDRTQLTERQRSFAGAIRSSAETLLRIVNDLLDFSRAESGQLAFEDISFVLPQLIDDVVALFREQARERGVALHVFVDPALPMTISGDPTRIRQILQNLLNNAVRFTESGSIRVDVTPELPRGSTPMLRFAVHDTGIGIARGAQERIFDAFTQADSSTTRRFGGTGLGLAITKHLVELMGGRIMVRSLLGVGSTFMFTIPLRGTEDSDRTMPLRDLWILVVENDPTIRELLHRYVAGWEMRALPVATLEGALTASPEFAPGEDGFAVLLVGPSTKASDATALVRRARELPALARADAIYIRGEHCQDGPCPDGFGACISGPLRQSTLFDTITRLRRDGFIESVTPTIEGVALRRPRRERILIAEDNDVNQALLVAQLEHLGFRADVVDDGHAAVQAATTKSYDLIFMDCQMPGIDGFEASRRIRSVPTVRQVPIIAVTANVLPGYREICIAAGMNDYLAKPALIAPLARIVDNWLPSQGTPPPTVRPPNAGYTPSNGLRERLREIFLGDDARVDATISLATSSLREGSQSLQQCITQHDADAAARVAHKMKGISLEVGFLNVADLARRIEEHLKASDWNAAIETESLIDAAIETQIGLLNGVNT